MLKVKTLVILIIIYIISFITIKTKINLFYPYYYLKDFLFFPVHAIDNEIEINDEVKKGIEDELKREIDELKKLHDLSSTLTEFTPISSLIIERNKMYWFNTITINKGSSSGIKEDMAVISSKGLVGKVNKVGKTTSEIKLITTNDVNNKISVMIKTNDDIIYGILSGYDETCNCLKITSVNKEINIENGSLIYTSGLGGIFPSGILIGSVEKTLSDKYDVSKIIYVKPSSNFNNIRFVNVLIRN